MADVWLVSFLRPDWSVSPGSGIGADGDLCPDWRSEDLSLDQIQPDRSASGSGSGHVFEVHSLNSCLVLYEQLIM